MRMRCYASVLYLKRIRRLLYRLIGTCWQCCFQPVDSEVTAVSFEREWGLPITLPCYGPGENVRDMQSSIGNHRLVLVESDALSCAEVGAEFNLERTTHSGRESSHARWPCHLCITTRSKGTSICSLFITWTDKNDNKTFFLWLLTNVLFQNCFIM